MRRLLVCLAVLGALAGVISACGGDPTPIFSPTPSASVSRTPTQPASPTGPPTMPEAARQHTRAGAIAFVKYYWAVANYAQETLDVAPLKSLASKQCAGCAGGVKFVTGVRARGGTISGGRITTSQLEAAPLQEVSGTWMAVRFMWTATPQKVDYPEAKQDKSYSGGSRTDRMVLKPTSAGWLAANWELGV